MEDVRLSGPQPVNQPFGAPVLPASMSARQRSLHRRLVDQDAKRGDQLGAMYAGALAVLESESPDRFAQAAHSCREVIQRLVRLREQPDTTKGLGNPRDRGIELQDAWETYRRDRATTASELVGESVDAALVVVLQRLELYCDAGRALKPKREFQVEQALKTLGLTDAELPDTLQAADIALLKKLWSFFDRAAHHDSKSCTPELVRAEVKRLEDLLMRWVPQTFADLDEIDSLIGGSGA